MRSCGCDSGCRQLCYRKPQFQFALDHFQHGFRHGPVVNHAHKISFLRAAMPADILSINEVAVIVHIDFRITRHLDQHHLHRSEQAEHAAEFIPNDVVDEREVMPIPAEGKMTNRGKCCGS